MKVYLLTQQDMDCFSILGIYKSEDTAQKAFDDYAKIHGSCDLYIDEYEVQ